MQTQLQLPKSELRHRSKGNRTVRSPRNELFGNANRSRSLKASQKQQRTRASPLMSMENAAKALNDAIFLEQQAKTADLLVTGQSKIQQSTNQLIKETRDINKKVTETLSISHDIRRGVRDIKNMLATPGGTASLMMNPFFSLVVFFLAHPYLPVTIETIMPVWSVILSVNYVKRVTTKIAKGEAVLELGGGVLGIVRSAAFSAPHAIVLMYKLATMWTAERTGTQGYNAAKAATFSTTHAASNWEPFLAQQFTTGMETLRGLNLQALQSSFQSASLPAMPAVNVTEWRNYLEGASDRVYTDIQSLDPTLFQDKAGCIQLILQYAMGKLAVKGKGVAVATLNMPAYLHQARTVIAAEQWVLQCLIHMLNDIFHQVFRDLWESVVAFTCGALCAYDTVMPVAAMGGGVGGGLFDWVSTVQTGTAAAYTAATEKITAGTAAATEYVMRTTLAKTITEFDYVGTLLRQIARLTCDCRKYGKVKMDGGSPVKSSRMTRRLSGKRGGLPADHAAFLRLSFRYVMFLLAPVLTDIPLFPTPASYLALETEMRQLLGRKVETGQFVPPLVLKDVDAADYSLAA